LYDSAYDYGSLYESAYARDTKSVPRGTSSYDHEALYDSAYDLRGTRVSRSIQMQTPRAFLPLLQHKRYKGIHGGRGGGKSHILGELLLEEHLLYPGTRSACIREVQRSLDQSVKRLLEDKIRKYSLEHEFTVKNTHIVAPGDGIIIFEGMQDHTSDSIKSLEAFRIGWFEEAQTASRRSLELLRPTFFRVPRSELWFSWNPRNAKDPVDQMFRGPAKLDADDAVCIEVSYKDNPWMPPGLLKEMQSDYLRDTDKYNHVWLGGYESQSEARVFRNWKIGATPTPPPDTVFYIGADWGYSIDPTVAVRVWLQDTTIYVTHEAKVGGYDMQDRVLEPGIEIDDIPAFFQQHIPGIAEWPCTADSARPETISYLKRHGLPNIKASIKGANSVIEGVRFIQNYDIVVEPRCEWTIHELSTYSYKRDSRTQMITPILEDKKNHVIDALRYALEDVRLGAQELVW